MKRRQKAIAGFNSWQRQQFSYGTTDCCQFVSSMIIHMGGPDYSAGWCYNSEDDASEIINKYGSLLGLAIHILGTPSEEILDGDPVLCKIPTVGEVMGVYFDKSVVCLTARGMIRIKSKYIIHGWSICHR
jgi:hypothetical protein